MIVEVSTFHKSQDSLSNVVIGYHETKHATIDIPTVERSISIMLPMAPDLRFPGLLTSLEHITYKYSPKSNLILQGVNLNIYMGDRIGVVGLNGSGKSTLIKIITDIAKRVGGNVARHPRIRLGYYSQHAVEDLQNRYGLHLCSFCETAQTF